VRTDFRLKASSRMWSAALCSLLLSAGAVCSAQEAGRPEVILERYVEAVGSKPNIERIHSRVTQSSMSLGRGITAKLETVQQLPNRVVERGVAKGWGWSGDFGRGFDGQVGWTREPDRGLRTIEGTLLQQFALKYRLDRDARLDQLYPTRQVLPDALIDGRNQHVLKLTTTFATQELWYLDATTGLLTSTEVIENRGAKEGAVRVTTTFEDYREIDGVRLPFRTIVHDGKRTRTVSVMSIANNGPINDTFGPNR
jgi:zinc protease